MMNAPQESVPDAAEKCYTAGSKIIMVTCDNPITVKATAKFAAVILPESGTVEKVAQCLGIPFLPRKWNCGEVAECLGIPVLTLDCTGYYYYSWCTVQRNDP
jgi:magnesium-transporting ATPase (P-type)